MERRKFSDVCYERPVIEEVRERFERLGRDVTVAPASATSQLLSRWLELDALWMGARTICEIGFSRDMEDARFAADKRFFDQHDGHVKEWSRTALAGLLRPPHREVLVREQGEYFVDFLDSEIQLVSAGSSDLVEHGRAWVSSVDGRLDRSSDST